MSPSHPKNEELRREEERREGEERRGMEEKEEYREVKGKWVRERKVCKERGIE